MFERYTEKARQVIFFARYEASYFGSPYIETEHLLLGLLRVDKALSNRFLPSYASVEGIRKQIEARTIPGEKVSTSVDLPLSNESKHVLSHAAEEAERLGHKRIGPEHLLLGLLREENCFAAHILRERGLRLETIREGLARSPHTDIRAIALHPPSMFVFVDSVPPGAEVEIDGAFYGNTPAHLPLAAGERSIKLTLKGYRPWERRLQVMEGGNQNVIAELERIPPYPIPVSSEHEHSLIALTGFMGSGKTDVGRALAEILGWPFSDLDRGIEQAVRRSIDEIFRQDGEERFREIETDVLRSLLELQRPFVLATGGGTYVQPRNAELLRAAGATVVFLEASAETLLQRCSESGDRTAAIRPLARDPETFMHLYKERLPRYRTADLTVVSENKPPQAVAQEIAEKLRLLRH